MRLELPYGTDRCKADLDWGRLLGVLDIADAPALDLPEAALAQAIEAPIGLDGDPFARFRPGQTVAIVVSDSFRKTRIELLLPTLLDRLDQVGIAPQDICFVYATGSHRPPTDAEQAVILGQAAYDAFRGQAYAHDPRDTANLVHMGTTSRDTPVWLNRRVVEADHVIVTGAVVMHYFGGFGGGRKAILPGISGLETISHNHAMNLDPIEDRINPDVRIGALDGNPVAEDMLEGARMLPVDLLVNTVLDRHGAIAGVFVGELEAAHREACAFARKLYAVPIAEQADLVIAASGPTRNFVQTHKALYNAYQAVKPEGRMVLVARCEEGLGGEQFQKWLRLGNRAAIIAGLRRESEINGQTALSTIQKSPITAFVTDLSEAEVTLLGGRKAPSLEAALGEVRGALGPDPTVYVMPSAAYAVPMVGK